MTLPTNFTVELRARTPIVGVIGRRVRLVRSGKNWKGCCPFHDEKTPSFYVYDDGYHCFGCGAHGDTIGFLMQTQGLTFMEAVNQLAGEAGMSVPQASPDSTATERRRVEITQILEAAKASFRRGLAHPNGRRGKDYLLGRGVTEEMIDHFGLGWAGERGTLIADLASKGIDLLQLEAAGLIRRDSESGRTFELFKDRIIFPIHDRRGSIISFGGRILGGGHPKYVNGAESLVFSKRLNLYGMDLAIEPTRRGASMVVVEGYMDVIAANQAGFKGAVAPLGTALTQEQLNAIWHVSTCPFLCFDGDSAGLRAASKAMELALPMLTSSRSLKFVTLPPGEDPDSLLRNGGSAAFANFLDTAKTPTTALYDMIQLDVGYATPEQRATLRRRLTEAAARITDKALASEYRRVLLDRFFAQRRRATTSTRHYHHHGEHSKLDGPQQRVVNGRMGARLLPRVSATNNNSDAERFRILLAILLNHPTLIPTVFSAFASLPASGGLARLRDALGDWAGSAGALDSSSLMNYLTSIGLPVEAVQVLTQSTMPLPTCIAADATPYEAERIWWHIFGLLSLDHLRAEVALAQAEAIRNWNPVILSRLTALRSAVLKIESGGIDIMRLWDA